MDTLTTYALAPHLPTLIASFMVVHLVVAAHEPYLLPRHVWARRDEERGITGCLHCWIGFAHLDGKDTRWGSRLQFLVVLSTLKTSFRVPVQTEADNDGTSFPQEDAQTLIAERSNDSQCAPRLLENTFYPEFDGWFSSVAGYWEDLKELRNPRGQEPIVRARGI
ncbi:hypothetical protein IW261DRAFT_1417656 [Armillaria novae-zelandiae]|uniref:Uncharacterized protein n=1 Tax=Armillaria novae-zelandiae TaxID=153914 RepID=A0AA39TEG6_9AGAR|nr:hypothetical protein IW261DRAFT_1417656 [Armillaria novae-zelandiae]